MKALRLPERKTESDLLKAIEDILPGEIHQEEERPDHYYYKNEKGQSLDITLTSEGIRKLGVLTALIRNKSLKENAIVFIDEPENSLHPEAQRKFVQAIMELSKFNIQFFLATHSYYILNELEIQSKKLNTEIACGILGKNKKNEVELRQADLSEGMPENGIMEQALKMYDDKVKLLFSENAKGK